MNQPRWKLLYDSLIDPAKGPQHILADWTGPLSLLRRALNGKRLRERLAMHEELVRVKARYALLAAAGELAGKLQAAVAGVGLDREKVSACIEGLARINKLMEHDWTGGAGQVDVEPAGSAGHVDIEPAGEKSACRTLRLDQDSPPRPEDSPAGGDSVIGTVRTAESTQPVPPAKDDGQRKSDPAKPPNPCTVRLPDGVTCTPEEARWLQKKFPQEQWTRQLVLNRESHRRLARLRAQKERQAAPKTNSAAPAA